LQNQGDNIYFTDIFITPSCVTVEMKRK